MKITERIKLGKILISDGAWGTFLQKKGLQPGECPEMWNLTHRSDVLDIAKSYIHAGAHMIETNSFGANRIRLSHFGLENKVVELNRVAAEISREAAGKNKHVLGSIGPCGKMIMTGDVTESELYEVFCEQASALERGGADALCIETMSDITEATLAVKAARENTSCEIICTFSFDRTISGDYRTMVGVSPKEMALALKSAGADIIGTNCGNGMERMIDIVKEIRSVSDLPLLVHANAGLPQISNEGLFYSDTPEIMANYLPALIAAGANIIGGCCGTTPEHIALMAQKV